MYLFIDTETTGKYHFDKRSDDPLQPKIVELAALLCDENGNEWGDFNFLIDNNCDIPEEATAIHGITREHCKKYGVTFDQIIDSLIQFGDNCNIIIGHNISFDIKMIRSAMGRAVWEAQTISNKLTYCTMHHSTQLCKIPKSKGNGYKWPRLSEAYKIICGKELVGAHRAMADVRACKEIYFKMMESS